MYAIDKEIKETIDSLNSNMGYPTDNSGIILERYLEPVIDSTNLVEKDKAYHIKIRTEKPGVASIATTSKISNLRFRLKDLILEGIPKTFATFKAILGSDTNTLLLGITILNFFKIYRGQIHNNNSKRRCRRTLLVISSISGRKNCRD